MRAAARLEVSSFADVRFADLLAEQDIVIDRVGIPGVQDKASLAMVNVPVAAAGQRSLLKLNPPEYRHLVENEAFFLARAPRSRARAAQRRIVHHHDQVPALVVTRFDRHRARGAVRALAVEDGCQVLELHPEAKYRRSTEDVLAALVRACAAPFPAALEFVRQAVFAYVTGNGDAHAKNFSILTDRAGRWAPSPAYDVPSSYPYGDSTLALRVGGRNDGSPAPGTSSLAEASA